MMIATMKHQGLVSLSIAIEMVLGVGVARADHPSGLALGVRTGYALMLGSMGGSGGGAALTGTTTGVVPIWIDAGYRFNPKIAVGGYFQYNLGSGLENHCPYGPCTTRDIQIGAQVLYYLMPDSPVDPWIGIGVGYEFLNYVDSGGGITDYSWNGIDFLTLQAGGDFKAMASLGLGPFVAFSFGEFLNCSTWETRTYVGPCLGIERTLHEWLTFGIRGAYDINLRR
jgi:hypothetical protein